MSRSILTRRTRPKVKRDFELPLTSMMDMLIILLVFLLKSYSTSPVAFTTSDNIALPASHTPEEPTEGMNVMIEPPRLVDQDGKQTLVHGAILLEGNKIAEFNDEPPLVQNTGSDGHLHAAVDLTNLPYALEPRLVSDRGLRILPLFDALVKEKEKVEYIQSTQKFVKDGKPAPAPKFNGTLYIHADKTVQYQLLRRIMYTAAAAEFKTFKLVTAKKDDEGAAPPQPAAPQGG